MNLKMRLLIIKHLRILRFMGAMRAKRFRGSLIMDQIGTPGEGTRRGLAKAIMRIAGKPLLLLDTVTRVNEDRRRNWFNRERKDAR